MKSKDEKTEKIKVKAGLKSKTIKVDYLSRVEGEGSLYIKTKKDKVQDVKLKIFEPPRLFEALLQGRSYLEAPDITARICGICPVAYQMSAVAAMEDALKMQIPEPIQALRRLLYCGEWIESHTLHVTMLHIPDFLGYEDAIQMSKQYPDIVKKGLAIKKAGNAIVTLVGGREIHPINVRVGGFYSIPKRKQFLELREQLLQARDWVLQYTKWVNTLDYPDFTKEYEFVSTFQATAYPMIGQQLTSSKGLSIAAKEYDAHFQEIHVAHSNALHSRLRARGAYFVGPMARYNLHADKLSELVLATIKDVQFEQYCQNPFRSLLIRCFEILYAFDEAIAIIENFHDPDKPYVQAEVRAATGYGCSEAPRGLLYHCYSIDEQGLITDARIIPPTSQNQLTIEDDLKVFVQENISKSKQELTWQCEQAIRNYDPCISCSTHFLKVDIEHV